MSDYIFLLALATIFSGALLWAVRVLPGERWQIFAAVPVRRDVSGTWTGLNLTFYGFLVATSYVAGIMIFLVLLGAIGATLTEVLCLVSGSLFFCLPTAWILARFIEKKRYTLTVGGATLVGLLIAPLLIYLVNRLAGVSESHPMELMSVLAAMSVGYLVGEGLGRFACISFGCCYGKPLDQLNPFLRRALSGISFTFFGRTRKIAYESDLEGVRVVPIQAMTSLVFLLCALVAVYLFLNARFHATFGLSVLVSQAWRVLSETLRADFRGGPKFTTYQKMAVVSCLYAIALLLLSPGADGTAVSIETGLSMLWTPGLILTLQIIWVGLFLATGCSKVTNSTVTFHVRRDRV